METPPPPPSTLSRPHSCRGPAGVTCWGVYIRISHQSERVLKLFFAVPSPQACLAGLFYTAISVLLSGDHTIGARVIASAALVGTSWIGLLMCGVAVSAPHIWLCESGFACCKCSRITSWPLGVSHIYSTHIFISVPWEMVLGIEMG